MFLCQAMPLYYPQMLVDEINSLILVSKDDTAIIENFKMVMVLLRQAGAVTKQVLHTSQVLCHPKNRAGLMLNGFNAHRNAANVMHIGADRDQLKGAIAFETSPFPIERQHQRIHFLYHGDEKQSCEVPIVATIWCCSQPNVEPPTA